MNNQSHKSSASQTASASLLSAIPRQSGLRHLAAIGAVAAVVFLAGCGGGGGGGGSSTNSGVPASSATAQVDSSSSVPACSVSGNQVTVPEGGSCTHSNPDVNDGAAATYKCESGKVSSGGTSATSMTWGSYTYSCAS